ncbi:Hpt domain-containing protein [Rhodobacterales bacterium HKCCE2091]|nr:Hpt domain-containing protein [Rhodobacterales bacterium HKCCE2091]
MIDWDRVQELREELGDEDFAEVGQIFISEIEEKLAALSGTDARAPADFHFLRGSAANLGLEGFARSCSTAEARAKAGDPVDLDALARDFAASLREIDGLFDAA